MRLALIMAAWTVAGLLTETTWPLILGARWLAPDIPLVLCVYLGLRRHSAWAATGAFALGYLEDAAGGGPTGVNAFAFCLIFSLVYLTSTRLWVDNATSRTVVVVLAVGVKVVAVVVVLALCGVSVDAWLPLLRSAFPGASLTAAVAPLVFASLGSTRQPATPRGR